MLVIQPVTSAYCYAVFKLWPYFSATLATVDAKGKDACYKKLGLE